LERGGATYLLSSSHSGAWSNPGLAEGNNGFHIG